MAPTKHAFSAHEQISVTTPQFRILYVCTANLYRSVLAEHLTRLAIDTQLAPFAERFLIESAGISAIPDLEMHSHIAQILRKRGVEIGSFVTKRLNSSMIENADLVLTATSVQRDRTISMAPTAMRCVFTLKEFARLIARVRPAATNDIVSRAHHLVMKSATMRGQLSYLGAEGDDILDPSHNRRAIERCAASVDEAVRSIFCARSEPNLYWSS